MTLLTTGNIVNSLNPYKNESYQFVPNIRTYRHLAYGKLPTSPTTQIPLFVPSRTSEIPDKPFVIPFDGGTQQLVYAIHCMFTVPVLMTGTAARFKVGSSFTSANTVTGNMVGEVKAGTFQALIKHPGDVSPVFSGIAGNQQLSLFVLNSSDGQATGGMQTTQASTDPVQQKLAKEYAEKAYVLVEICTTSLNILHDTSGTEADFDLAKPLIGGMMDLILRGL